MLRRPKHSKIEVVAPKEEEVFCSEVQFARWCTNCRIHMHHLANLACQQNTTYTNIMTVVYHILASFKTLCKNSLKMAQ